MPILRRDANAIRTITVAGFFINNTPERKTLGSLSIEFREGGT
jgi:hypothetical protein